MVLSGPTPTPIISNQDIWKFWCQNLELFFFFLQQLSIIY